MCMDNKVHLRDSFENAMAGLFWVFLFTVLQTGFSMPTCQECVCCSDGHQFCDSNYDCVDGCIAGYFGERCTNECIQNCKSCVNGYECTECRPGYYTNKCNLLCGKGCVNNTCSVSSGECSCKSAKFATGKCDTCLGNMYGEECNNACPINCGSCILGTECSWCINTAYYGSYCQYRCPVGCFDGRCNKGNGYCQKGCKLGFVGSKCDMCSFGLYGTFCDLNCTDNCLTCFSDTNCTYCARHTGACLHGCKSVSNYGDYCEKQCSDTCNNRSCDWKTGQCLEGCVMNYYGSFCDTLCPFSCLPGNDKRVCDEINGRCLLGCRDGIYGNKCKNKCTTLCVNTTCNKITGECLYGCIHGFKGPNCLEAIILERECYSKGTLIGSIFGSFLAGGVVAVAALFAFITWRRRALNGYYNSEFFIFHKDITHEDGSPVAYEDFNSRDEIAYSQISTNQQISPPEDVYTVLFKGITVDTMTRLVSVILVLVCQIGLSMQACNECACCKGSHNCDSNNNCVDGCIDGYYGNKCTEECLENCKTCVNCTGCTECRPGYYTNKCNLQCGKGCLNNTCSFESGQCSCTSINFVKGYCDTCLGLKYGDECNNTCPSNCGSCISDTECPWCINSFYYGSYCQYRCSVGCDDGSCNKNTGYCTEGCKPGFTGDKCNTCSPGLHGRFCDLNCTENCLTCLSATNCLTCKFGFYSDTCMNTCPTGCDGNCSLIGCRCSDCKPGFYGEYCNHTCRNETYGYNCSQLCRNVDEHCNTCITSESGKYGDCLICDRGYYLISPFEQTVNICRVCPNNCLDKICDTVGLCNIGCVRGKWGDRCNFDCEINCVECNKKDGQCLECTRDMFSENCTQTCSSTCNRIDDGRTCAQDTGTCLQGCKSFTKYGEYCEKHCSDTCNNKSCDLKTGYCTDGCAMNYYGSFCDKTCADACQSNERKRVCDVENGDCLYGCKDGFRGKRCNNICDRDLKDRNALKVYKITSIQPGQEGHTTGTLIGSIAGSFVAGGIIVGVATLIAFIVWRRRHGCDKQADKHGYEKKPVPGENCPNDCTFEMNSPVTYEALKSRDEILYSQNTTNQQISPPATVYEVQLISQNPRSSLRVRNPIKQVLGLRKSAETHDDSFMEYSTTVDTMTRLVSVILVLVCQIGLSMQACNECACCKGSHNCDTVRNCRDGCIDGYYGDKCTTECLENCKTCVNGYGCTECKPGYYTDKCIIPCGKGCLNNTCKLISGECTCKSSNFIGSKCDACVGLWYGDECNNTCPSNCGSCISDTECTWCVNTAYYGSYCQYRCSPGCDEGKCRKYDGYCSSGCKPGYIGDKCDACSPGTYGNYCELPCPENCYKCVSASNCTVCKTGFYGETCTNTCSSGCYGNCSIADGRCFECRPDFVGEFCDTCKDGTYGVNCSKLCRDTDLNCQECISDELGIFRNCIKCNSGSYIVSPFDQSFSRCINCSNGCIDNTCSTEGLCESGCVRGKWGDMCNSNCPTSCLECSQTDGSCLDCTRDTFSDDCSQNCNTNCNVTANDRICTRDVGKCLHGCKSITKYGEYCENPCSYTCKNETCDWKTGHCLEGCVINYHGLFCDNLCSTSCLSYTGKRVCDDIKCHCLFGCKKGFSGNKCDKLCSSQCINITCNQVTAECLYGCTDGFKGSKCLEAILLYRDGILIGSIVGSILAGGIVVGVIALVAFKVWKRRNGNNKETNTHGYENTQVDDEYRTNGTNEDTHDSDSPVTYEDLKSRDDRLYSELSTSHQLSPPPADYVNSS
ncbi:multiple epidermal growth factor-like domains protein 6 [Ruditapes philippinarum]|uniref:multiple epidermal growth factor-like domains protein 6 n=1 Tax=Ruditapes philippinarum TaxID=129788 RepID=UPI00295BB160|nr:multiple epidermal growth factor-like domains protein 6 [Ruditapes philippinarum]